MSKHDDAFAHVRPVRRAPGICPQRILEESIRILDLLGLQGDEDDELEECITNNIEELKLLIKRLPNKV